MPSSAQSWRSVDRSGSYLAALGTDTGATYLVYFALAWLAAAASSRVWVAPIVLGLETVPKMVLGLFGGALADRWGVWRTARYTLGGRVLLALAAIPVFSHLRGASQIVGLMILAVLLGLLDAIHEPALDAAAGLMAPDEAQQNSLTGLSGVVMQTAEVLAGPIVGFLIAWRVGAPAVAAAILVCAAWVLFSHAARGRPEVRESTEGLWRDAVAGIGAARSAGVMPILLLLTVTNAVATAPLVGALPLIAHTHHWSSSAFGFAAIAFAVGSILGAFVASRLSEWPSERRSAAAIAALIPAAVSLSLFSVAASPQWVFAAAAGMGVACQFAGRLLFALIRSRTPGSYLGRVMGLTQAAVYVGVPVGYGLYAVLASVFNPPVAGLVLAAVLMVFAIGCLIRPRLWSMGPETAGSAPAASPDQSRAEAP